jgi:hypothetical protein
MFGRTKHGPSQPTGPFEHAAGCAIVRADPDFEPQWQEQLEQGHWRRTCQCYAEDIYEPPVDTRSRLDPLDPSTFGHFPACEHRDTIDPVIVKAILTVLERETYLVRTVPHLRGWLAGSVFRRGKLMLVRLGLAAAESNRGPHVRGLDFRRPPEQNPDR